MSLTASENETRHAEIHRLHEITTAFRARISEGRVGHLAVSDSDARGKRNLRVKQRSCDCKLQNPHMRFYVLVHATKFPAMDICYPAQRMRFLWPLCLFDVSSVSNRCACSVCCLLSARAKVLGWLVHILCLHSHGFWGVKRI